MAINKIDYPATPTPALADWEKLYNIVNNSFNNISVPLQFDSASLIIPAGTTFYVLGDIYYTDADTVISGTLSDYVKLTVNGTTLDPSFVTDLTGVSWNNDYNGYYDVSNNYYIFDEFKAYMNSAISSLNTRHQKIIQSKQFYNRILNDISLTQRMTVNYYEKLLSSVSGYQTTYYDQAVTASGDLLMVLREYSGGSYHYYLKRYNGISTSVSETIMELSSSRAIYVDWTNNDLIVHDNPNVNVYNGISSSLNHSFSVTDATVLYHNYLSFDPATREILVDGSNDVPNSYISRYNIDNGNLNNRLLQTDSSFVERAIIDPYFTKMIYNDESIKHYTSDASKDAVTFDIRYASGTLRPYYGRCNIKAINPVDGNFVGIAYDINTQNSFLVKFSLNTNFLKES